MKKFKRRAPDEKENAAETKRPGAVLLLFLAFLFGFSLINLLWPKRTISTLENRRLAAFPTVSVDKLVSGKAAEELEVWAQDQVAFRDSLLWLESAMSAIGLQKVEENGILLGKDGWMFTEQFDPQAADYLERNLDAVCNFAERYPGRVYFMLAPSAAVIYPEELPFAAPMVDENAMLDGIFARVASAGAAVLDPREIFTDQKEEGLYYRTDHHWTTQGAYLAYRLFADTKGLAPFVADPAKSKAVPDFYGTHYSATRRWNVVPDTITWYPMQIAMTVYKVAGEAKFSPTFTGPMIDEDKFSTRDKYAAFLGGNNGYTELGGDGVGNLLVVKDSYANCFVPFLTPHYRTIGIVDFRGYAYGLDSLIQERGYDEILILYNYQTFISDKDFINLSRPTTLG